MASYFSYYRPRGVPGNYIVEIVLDLADTETGEVWVDRNRDHPCGKCGKQEPTRLVVLPDAGTKQLPQYIIGNIVVGDIITVQIQDEKVFSVQVTRHTATMESFYHEPIPFYHNGAKWDVVYLNPLLLMDKDKGEKWFDMVPHKPQPQLILPNVYQDDFQVREVPSEIPLRRRRLLNERN